MDNNRRFFCKCRTRALRGSSAGVARDNRRALPRDGARSPAGHGIALMVFAGRRGARDGARFDSIRGRRAARELHGRPSRLDRGTPDT